MLKGYKKLTIWEKAHKLAIDIYRITEKLPKTEQYGLCSQIRRASFSISINIVEGQASQSKKDFLNFLNIANRSLVETEYLLEIISELKFIEIDEYKKLESTHVELGLMLHKFIQQLRNKES
ncbi:MAG: four helix bundle protein [bacterium]